MSLRFGLLGPLEIVLDGHELRLKAGRQRVLLAALLMSANHVVTAEQLMRHADVSKSALQTYIMRLRRALGEAACIETTTEGYLIRADGRSLDLLRFRELVADGVRRSAEDPVGALDCYTAARALWRGDALCDIDSDSLRRDEEPRLAEELVAVQQRWAELSVHIGRTDEVVAELTDLTRRNPTREPLWRLLMLALYQSGRAAEALEAYHSVRRLLADELGVDPGPQLQELYQSILTGVVERPTPEQAPDVPRQLPPDVVHFAGRVTEFAKLDALIGDRPDRGVVIVAIDGMPGVGKTALALRWAHRVQDRYPDGQLYINLRGYGPSAPMEPAAALESLLAGVGVGAGEMPVDLVARSGLLRTRCAGRRILIVLDNARDAEQVRPLLPGSSCLVIVTSRNHLASLVVRDGATRISLDELATGESLRLVKDIVGSARAATDPAAIGDFARLCGHLPLALRIVAQRVAAYPDVPLREFVDELDDERNRLVVFDTDTDESLNLRAAFECSYRTLSPDQARLFRLLGAHPGNDISTAAAAALAGIPVSEARLQLRALAGVHLIEERRPSRFGLHDLLRAYAIELGRQIDDDTDAAIDRLLGWLLYSGRNARLQLRPLRAEIAIEPLPAGTTPLTFDNYQSALDWTRAEYANVVSLVRLAAATKRHSFGWQIPIVFLLELHDGWDDRVSVLELAVASANASSDPVGELDSLAYLSQAYRDLRRYEEADQCLQRALEISLAEGDAQRHSLTLYRLGTLEFLRSNFARARTYQERAIEISGTTGNDLATAVMHNNLALTLIKLGDYVGAREHGENALATVQDNDPSAEGNLLDTLGQAAAAMGDYGEAVSYYRRSLAINRRLYERRTEAECLTNLGDALMHTGDVDGAVESWTLAVEIYQRLGSPWAHDVQQRLQDYVADAGRLAG